MYEIIWLRVHPRGITYPADECWMLRETGRTAGCHRRSAFANRASELGEA